MSYSPPSVGVAGLSIPTYTDFLTQIEANFRSIYGQSVYLGNDSADHQFIAVIALALADAVQGLQLVYNSRSPATAVGSGLDAVVKINGLRRKVPSFSTCQVTVTGSPGTIINNGVAQDNVFGQKWDLPILLTIPGGGTITVSAVCETLGAFALPPGTLIKILTPQQGWTSVNNASASVPGQPVETDSQLRARQAISAELPSITLLTGTVAGIAVVANVTRWNVVENPTSAVDSLGNPPHSITAVVEGGVDLDVATAIYNNRGIGCFTNPNPAGAPTGGSTTVPITDPFTNIVLNIGFVRPTVVPIFVTVNAHLLPGGSSATIAAMRAAVILYLNSLQVGELVSFAAVSAAAMSVNPDLTRPIITIPTIFIGTAALPTGVVDISMLFYKVASGLTANVFVNSI